MNVVESLEALPQQPAYPVMAIGVFDGVHRGHQAILEGLRDRARETAGTSLVLSFHPHPQKVIRPGDAPRLLQTGVQKEQMLRRLGIDYLIRHPFTRRLSLYTPDEFARRILYSHGIKEIRVGANFRFGHRRSGDFQTLQRLGQRYGFEVVEVEAVHTRGLRISSTLIRRALDEGRTSLARHLLGRPYQIRGVVIRGEGRGAGLGFPTANLQPRNELLPSGGVYLTHAWVNGDCHASVTNIGVRPTLDRPAAAPIVETHLLDYTGDLYGKSLALDFWLRWRDEKKFDNLQRLREQIGRDIEAARRYFDRLERIPRWAGRLRSESSPA